MIYHYNDFSSKLSWQENLSSLCSETNSSILTELFKRNIVDVISVVSLVGVSCACMTMTPVIFQGLVIYAITTIAIQIFLHLGEMYVEKNIDHQLGRDLSINLIKALRSINFGVFFYLTAGVLIHEAGHFTAATLLFNHANPTIAKTSALSAVTFWNAGSLTPLGNMLGVNGARFCVSIAGSLAGVTMGTVAIIVALALRKSRPNSALTSGSVGYMAISNHVSYALSAFSETSSSGHDFVQLWALGLNPAVAALGIVMIPVITALGYLSLERYFYNTL